MSEKIRNMFSDISEKYDILNDVLSFGIHRTWRRKVVKISGITGKENVSILDLATGTGDLAIAFKRKIGNNGKVIGIDFSEQMLEIAREKAKENHPEIEFLKGDAISLEYEDNKFDIATIAFGIRNVDSIIDCLNEMAGVVNPGGKVIILEFGQPAGFFSCIYKIYSKYIIPVIGKIISKNFNAYNYLQESSAKFPCKEEFLKIMNSTDKFSQTYYKQLSFGIAFIYVGVVR